MHGSNRSGLIHRELKGVLHKYAAPPNLIKVGGERISPEMLTLVELDQPQIDTIVRAIPGGSSNIQDIYPLAPLQDGILFHYLMNEQHDTYVWSTLLSIPTREKLDALILALQNVVDRNDILRTAVHWEQLPRPVQVVCRRATLPVKELELEWNLDPVEQLRRLMMSDCKEMDLRRAPLMRVEVAAAPRGTHWYVLLRIHHIVCDNNSVQILLQEAIAFMEGRAHTLPEPIVYRNHIAEVLERAALDESTEFFRSKLGDLDEPTAPFGLLDVRCDGTQLINASEVFEPTLVEQTRAQGRRLGVSVAAMFHAAWALVVAHTSGRDDVVFGTVLLGRLRGGARLQRGMGMFINTLPLRLRLRDVSVGGLVEQTQCELIQLLSHEQASLADVQRCSRINGGTPLFTSLLNYLYGAQGPESEWTEAGVRVLASEGWTNYPVAVTIRDQGDKLAVTAQTNRLVEPRRIAAYLQTAMKSLVDALERAPQTVALSLSVLPEREQHQLLSLFTLSPMIYPQQKLIHELFEQQVDRTPNNVAVTYQSESYTYAELNGRANQLARYLRIRGVGPDQLVAICMDRGLEMVVGLLGVLKAGGAYVPLDPNYPTERLRYVLQDAAPRVLLTQHPLRARLSETVAEVVALDQGWSEVAWQDASNLDARVLGIQANHLAYVIYTSGSTGKPKGVMVEHRNVTRLFAATDEWFHFSERDVWTLFHSFAFDFSVWELWGALLYGGRVVVVPYLTARSPEDFYSLLCEERVTVLNQTPSAFLRLIDAQELGAAGHYSQNATSPAFAQAVRVQARRIERAHSLRLIIFGGEALELRDLRRWIRRNGVEKPQLVNMYGITETTVHVTYCPLTEEQILTERGSLIGRPIPDLQVYLLNSQKQPVPIGVVGEMYIGGEGISRGYLNRRELSEERFIADPFGATPGARLYKSGDLARWRSDGTLEYLGRNDHQVKIRGFRIELGEIEAQLATYPRIKQAVVVTREDMPGEKRIVAYVVPQDSYSSNMSLSTEALRAYLASVLPEHMVPSAFVMLKNFPLTPNGKMDRLALPAPEQGLYVNRPYEKPEGKIEEALAGIWQELLQVKCVSRQDSFFELGGHSLLALKMLTQISQSLDFDLNVSDVYKYPRLRELASRICNGSNAEKLVILSQEATLNEGMHVAPNLRCIPAKNVLLTGSTGFVGRFLLTQLLQDTDAIVHCLVRAGSQQYAISRIRTTLKKWDLWQDEFAERIVAVPGDLRLGHLGLDETAYEILGEKLDDIYHCATSMNHLETYEMARQANVGGARELIMLAAHKRIKLINYISTLSVFGRTGTDAVRVVDENSSIDGERHFTSQGYAASKWVSEKIFMTAHKRGVPCNIFRLGLVWADTQRGRYDDLQREYRMIKSCLLSGCGIRNYMYTMAATPVDYVARAVVFLGNRYTNGKGIFHISSSGQKIGGIFEHCNEIMGTSLRLMSFYEWILEIKRLHYEGRALPAVPLMEFAFSMDEESFLKHQLDDGYARFNCDRTHRELERAGIAAPELDNDLLRVLVQSMLSRDAELREWLTGTRDASTERRHA